MKKLIVIAAIAAFALAATAALAQPGPGPGKKRGPRIAVTQAFIDCMEKQGVTKPERGTKPTEEQRAKAKAAFEACKQHLSAETRARLEAHEKFRACLKAQGVTKPERGTKPTEEQRAKAKAAYEACKQHLPQEVQDRNAAIQKFRECMKANGATKPERGTRPTEEQRAKNRAAYEACKQHLPAKPNRP